MGTVTQVELVGNHGLGLRDFVVPLLTLAGGLIGILIGGAINQRTLESVETRRDSRESSREAERARTELLADRRRAFGAARVLERELSHRALLIERLTGTFADLDPGERFTIDLHSDNTALLAAWLTDATWAHLSEAVSYLQHMEWDRPTTIAFEPLSSGAGSTHADAHSAVMAAITALENEIEHRLSSRAELPTR